MVLQDDPSISLCSLCACQRQFSDADVPLNRFLEVAGRLLNASDLCQETAMDPIQSRSESSSRYGNVFAANSTGNVASSRANGSASGTPASESSASTAASSSTPTTVTLSRRAQELAARQSDENERVSTQQDNEAQEARQASEDAAATRAAAQQASVQQANAQQAGNNQREAQMRRAYQSDGVSAMG
jgi:hypothetical protein